MKKFISIIVPLYNTNTSYFKRICDFISSQSIIDEIELVLVDDASHDKQYKDILNDVQFDYVLKELSENVGQGIARQIGADISNGEWLTFLDHDDDLAIDLSFIKNDISESKCELLYETSIIIANDYNFEKTGLYRVSNTPDYLHGKFINKEGLLKSGIKFHPELKSHEDTYFFGTLNAYSIVLQKQFPDRTIRYKRDDVVSYIWYLWQDSTSHKESYWSERNFSDFTRAMKESIAYTDVIFANEEITATRVTSAVLSLYMHIQCHLFKHFHDRNCKFDWLKEWKDFIDFSYLVSGLEKQDYINFVYSNPEIYVNFKKTATEFDGNFVEFYSFKEFINLID